MKKLFFSAIALMAFGLPALAELEEREASVWAFIEETWAEENGKWPTDFASADYKSWGQDEALPQTLPTLEATLNHYNSYSKLEHYRLKPASITVNQDTAVVNYYATEYRENPGGVKERDVTAVTETLVKRNGKWVFLASSTWKPILNE